MTTGALRYTGVLLLSAISYAALSCKLLPHHVETARDAAAEVEDAGLAVDAGYDAGAPAADGGEAPVIGLDFLPLETRTSDAIAQTVAHMEGTFRRTRGAVTTRICSRSNAKCRQSSRLPRGAISGI